MLILISSCTIRSQLSEASKERTIYLVKLVAWRPARLSVACYFLLLQENRNHKSGICIIVDLLQSVLGLPSECTHNNVIRSCTLSFSCWIQGGHHVEGCGENKWLFSCCISNGETMDFNQYNGLIKPASFFDMDLPARFNLMPKIKSQLMPSTPLSSSSTSSSSSASMSSSSSSSSSSAFKKNMLRRRMDDNGMVERKSSTFIAHSKFIAFNSCLHLNCRINSSVVYHVRLKTPFKSGSSVGVQHHLLHCPGKRTFVSLNINAAEFWYRGNLLLLPPIALSRHA